MGTVCTKRYKQSVFSQEDAERAYREQEKRMRDKNNCKPEAVDDQSETACFTTYEEQLNIRNVHLEDFENRLKQFVYKTPKGNERKSMSTEFATIKKKQLQIAFAGNKYLEAMINDKSSLDWRLLTQDNIFIVLDEEEDHFRSDDSLEEDPELTFRVDELNLLGLLYCKCDLAERIERFYTFL